MKKYVRHYVIGALVLTSLLAAHAQDLKISVGEAVKMAMENNKLLQAQEYQEQSAKESTKESVGYLLPTLSAHGSYSYFFDRQVIFMPGSFVGNESEPVVDIAVGGKNAFNTYLSLQQPILAGAMRRQVKNSKLNESIEQLKTSDQKAGLDVDVTSQYFTILLVKESLELNKQSLDRNIRSLKDSRSLLRLGKSLKIDTLSNYIAVENLRTTISYLETQYNIAMLELKRTIGIPGSKSLAFTDSLTIDDQRYSAEVGDIDEQSLANRPDIRQQKLSVELSKNQISQNRSLRLPILYLVGQYQLQAQADDRKLDSYNWPTTSFVGLQANIPIFSGMRTNAKVKQSTIQYQRSELLLAEANERAKTEVISLQNKLTESFRRHSTAEKTVEAAELNYKILSDRYRNGLSSRLDLADAELSLTEARLNELHSIYNVKITRLQLDKALGLLNY